MTFRPLAVFLVLAASPGLFAASQAAIAVSATAAQAYVRPVDDKGAPLPETYLFAEGQYFAGGTVDRGLSKTSFTDITRTMAANLAKQNYFPTSDRDGADLIIMVHWGATLTYEDPQREFNIEGLQAAAAAYNSAASSGNIVDTNELNYQLGLQEDARESTQQAIERNAILLGFKSSLEKERRAHMPTTADRKSVV